MKKIVIVFALSVLALVSAFAEMTLELEIATDIVKFNTKNPDDTKYFTSIDYHDFKVDWKFNFDMFGGHAALKADATAKDVTFDKLNAWGKISNFLKIQFGRFDNRAGNRLEGVIDEYELGILQYNTIDDGTSRIFKTLQEGNKLSNFVVDLYLTPISPVPVTLQFMMAPTESKKQIQFGGRAFANILDFVNINVTAVYFDNDIRYRTTIGTFFQFPNLIADLKLQLLVGYTIRIWEEKDIQTGDTRGLDHGIDLRAQIPITLPIGTITFATHSNLSLYGDPDDPSSEKYMALSNEIKARMPLKGGMAVSLALKSHYYSNPGKVIITDEIITAPKSFYDFSTVIGFDYTFGKNAILETGLKVLSIGNDQADIVIAIPFKFTFLL